MLICELVAFKFSCDCTPIASLHRIGESRAVKRAARAELVAKFCQIEIRRER